MADPAARGMPGTALDAGDEDASSESVTECDTTHGPPVEGTAKDASVGCGSFDTSASATFEAALRLVQRHLKNLADVHRREVSLLQLKSKSPRARFGDCAEPGHDEAGGERAGRGAGKEKQASPTARREAEATATPTHGGDHTSSCSSFDEEVKQVSLRAPAWGGDHAGSEHGHSVTPNRGLASRKIHFGTPSRASAPGGAAGGRQGILVKAPGSTSAHGDSSRRSSVAGGGAGSAVGSFAGSAVGSAIGDSDNPSSSEEEVWNYHSGDSSGSEAEAAAKGGCAGPGQKCARRSVKFDSKGDSQATYTSETDQPDTKAPRPSLRGRSFSSPNLLDLEQKGRRKLSFHPLGVIQSIRDLADGRAAHTPVVPMPAAAAGGAPGALAGGQQRPSERRRISIHGPLRTSVESEKSVESHVSVEEARDKVMEALHRRRSLGFSVVMAKHDRQQGDDGRYSTAHPDDKKPHAETQHEHSTVADRGGSPKRGEAPERDGRKFSVTSVLSSVSRGTTASRGARKCRFAAGDNLELRPPWDITDDSLCVELLPLFSVTNTIASESMMGRRDSNGSALTLNSKGPASTNQWNPRRWLPAARTILHPQSRLRLLFDIIGMLFLGYDIVMTPVLLCFPMPRSLLCTVMDWATVMFWTLDMGAAFCTAFHASDGSLVTDRCRIAKNYLRTWLCFDMVIVVPDWVLLLTDSNSIVEALGAMKIIRFIRILRLLRLVKLDKIVRDMQARINSNYFLLTLGILRLTTMLSITIHFIACIWYVLGANRDDGWIAVEGLGDTDARIIYLYLVSLQWSITQFQGGSSLVQPGHTLEVLFAVLTMMLALITYTSLLSSITHMMMQLSSLREERTKQMRALFGFLDDYHISAELSVRVKKYMESYKSQQQKEEQVTLLALLPKPILMDLHNEAHGPIITMHDFFNHCNTNHPRVTRHLCHEALQQVSFQHADTVFATGDACSRMFFVECGALGYKLAGHASRRYTGINAPLLQPHCNVASSASDIMSPADRGVPLARGQWIAEAALWTRWENCGDLVADTDCNLLTLDASSFAEVTERYDGAFAECVLYARAFVEGINTCRRLTDLPDFTVINSTTDGHVDLS